MSRKARQQDKSAWKTPSVYAFVGSYGPFRLPSSYDPISDATVLFVNSHTFNGEDSTRNPLYTLAGAVQPVLLQKDAMSQDEKATAITPLQAKGGLLVLDVADMFDSAEDYQEAMAYETLIRNSNTTMQLTKELGRPLLRLLQRLLLQRVTVMGVAGSDDGDSWFRLILKLHETLQGLDRDMIGQMVFVGSSDSFVPINDFCQACLNNPPSTLMVQTAPTLTKQQHRKNKRRMRRNNKNQQGETNIPKSTEGEEEKSIGNPAPTASKHSNSQPFTTPLHIFVVDDDSTIAALDSTMMLRELFPVGATKSIPLAAEPSSPEDSFYAWISDRAVGTPPCYRNSTKQDDTSTSASTATTNTSGTGDTNCETISSSCDILSHSSNEGAESPSHSHDTMKVEYDPNLCNDMGESLFVSRILVEMSRHSKQYERHSEDVTTQLLEEIKPDGNEAAEVLVEEHSNPMSAADWSSCEHHIGALVVRGNRCVLARSLTHKWKGLKIPSLVPRANESPQDTALRCVEAFAEVDAKTEVQPLDLVLPVSIYGPAHNRRTLVTLYALYATDPPPDGPLEDADMEDEDSPYDWYTFHNACRALGTDQASIDALHTIATTLLQAANVGLVPAKWGGVFGQELQDVLVSKPQDPCHDVTQCGHSHNHSHHHAPCPISNTKLLTASVEEWEPSRQGDVLQDVRKATAKVSKLHGRQGTRSPLPVTLLSGFLGSGKTTLMSHILTNISGLKVAILVNDMGDVNIDAALLKNNTVGVRQRQEHMVELSNGCICCTLREDLLVEVAKIAASPEQFDYLLIESSGIAEPLPVAETFTFEDSTGLKLGDVAQLDTLVTVVDVSRFCRELQSLESLQERNWHADAGDQRTIANLLCDQVEFANVIVLNKCDLLAQEADELEKVQQLIRRMNPAARVIKSTYSTVPLEAVLGTGLFSLAKAEEHPNWLQEARIGEHTPETEEYGIGSFTYRALRPFNPKKLHKLLHNITSQDTNPFGGIDGDVNENGRNIVLRAKGFVWLAHQPQVQGDFSLAGQNYSLVPGNPWWATIPREDWPPTLEEAIAPLWHEPYGDRQQEIVIIGQGLDREVISRAMDDCLLSDADFALGQEVWYGLCRPAYNEGDVFGWEDEAAASVGHGHDHTQGQY